MSVLHLQIFPVHSPVAKLDPSKYVQFSDEVEPHPIENVQQTPNPDAHDPEFTPLLLEHSSAV